jgi:hypothetical protein
MHREQAAEVGDSSEQLRLILSTTSDVFPREARVVSVAPERHPNAESILDSL